MGVTRLPNNKKNYAEIINFLEKNRQDVSGLLGLVSRIKTNGYRDRDAIEGYSTNKIEDELRNLKINCDDNELVRILNSLIEKSNVIVKNHFRDTDISIKQLEDLLEEWDRGISHIKTLSHQSKSLPAQNLLLSSVKKESPEHEKSTIKVVKPLTDSEVEDKISKFFQIYDSVVNDITSVLGGYTKEEKSVQDAALNKLPELIKDLQELISHTEGKKKLYVKKLEELVSSATNAYDKRNNKPNDIHFANLGSDFNNAARAFNTRHWNSPRL